MQYENTQKRNTDIGRELGVAAILEGSLRRSGKRVRIVCQLLDLETEEYLWAETYDRNLADIFAIQSEVAQRIASALKANLTDEENSFIEQKPTENIEAYEYYLRGNSATEKFYRRPRPKENLLEIAIQMYETAAKLDPKFVLTLARLTRAHLRMYWPGHGAYDHTEERLAKAKSALEQALNLDPNHPEVRLASGYYYYHGHRDFEAALQQFIPALKNYPNNSDLMAAIGWIKRRQGKWEEAIDYLRKALYLDPRNYAMTWGIGDIYREMRNWSEAERFYDRCILMDPEAPVGYLRKTVLYLRSDGDIEKARGVLEKFDDKLVWRRFSLEWLTRDYQKALEIIEADSADWYNWKALIYRLTGRPEKARTYSDSARIEREHSVRENPDDRRHLYLGWVYAGLGRTEDAIREAKLAVEMNPVSRDAYRGANTLYNAARIYAQVGAFEAALDQIEVLLSIPSPLTVPLLKISPIWDPLRDHPRFQKILKKFTQKD